MGIQENLYYYLSENIDPRTKALPFVESNYLIPSIVIVYLYIVLKWGPNYMKNKPPYNMKTFIRYYNVFQIFINGYITMRCIQVGLLDEPRVCHPLDYLLDPISVQVAYIVWLGWAIRIIDLVETVTFVFRKKDKQISFLHLYHHSVVTLLGWYIARFYANPMAAFHTLVNSFVHTVMYTYYYFSTFSDKAPKILQSIKPFITIMQMVQFIILLTQVLLIILLCNLPSNIPAYAGMINLIINLVLFYNFYRKTYSVQQKQKK